MGVGDISMENPEGWVGGGGNVFLKGGVTFS